MEEEKKRNQKKVEMLHSKHTKKVLQKKIIC